MDSKRPWGDAVVTGYGTIDGRPMFVFSQDFTVFGGSLGEVMAEKMCKVMDLAAKVGGAGDRPQRFRRRADPGGRRLARSLRRRLRPQRAVLGRDPADRAIMGPCAGGAVYSPAMTDFIFMVKETSHMFITGPEVIKTVTGEEVEFEELGGAMTHNSKSGVAHFAADDEEQCLEDIRYLIGFLPSNNLEMPPRVEPFDDPERADEALDRSSRPTRRSPTTCATWSRWSSTTATSSRSRSTSPRTSSSASAASTATRSGSWATSPSTSPGCSTSRPRRRRPGSCASATPSTSR